MKLDFSGPAPQAKTLEEAQFIINELWEMLKVIPALQFRVKALEEQVKKNSGNSSQPPSTDGFKPVPKSLRGKTGKSRGGQPGHQRRTLESHPNPDRVIYHVLSNCLYCQADLKSTATLNYAARQIFDIPPLKIEVTEHRVEQKMCPHCHQKNTASFPEEVRYATQYGARFKGLACYLAQYQLLPYERQQEFFATVFQCKVSQGMLVKINQECFVQLAGVESQIKQALQNAPYLHADESGIKVNKALYWCHVASTPELTHYTIHPKRGKLGIAAAEVLPDFHGRLIHDFFRPYFSYDCQHALCNAHHLRELKFIEEVAKQEWAQYMAALLLAIKKQVEWHQGHNLPMPDHRIATYERCYDEIIMMGLWHPDNLVLSNRKAGCGGYAKQTKAKNLLDRLRFHRAKVLAFLYDPNIPFTNNQAEQDIRMLKVKQKISGCFRSAEGSQWFARIRSYISTAKKQHQNILQILIDAFNNNPYSPACP